MDIRKGLLCVSVTLLAACGRESVSEKPVVVDQTVEKSTADKRPPNVVIFYVDDLGYGDLSSYGAVGVETPNVDALAAEGIRYTDAHAPAATCTPSRYSLLTGQFGFRNKAAVLKGDAAMLINPEQFTMADMFKQAGYKTAVIGKWHLGLGDGVVDWNQAVKPGPLELGFDYSFLIPATGDRVPTVYLENHNVIGLSSEDPLSVSYNAEPYGERPAGRDHHELVKHIADDQHADSIVNGMSRIGWMKGGKSAEWVDEDFPFVFTEKAIEYITENKAEPFMLFFPFHDIHVPRMPNERFVGKSTMGPRGDAIVQMDWMTGEIINALKAQGLFDNTLVIFSSDNGAVLTDGYDDQALELIGEHQASGPYRGGKYSAFEGGTRVPMIVTYPAGMVSSGDSDALMTHTDIFKSIAELLNASLPEDAAPDSVSVLPALLDNTAAGREEILEESYTLSLRDGQFKYIAPFPRGEMDWIKKKNIEGGFSPEPQLYDLSVDSSELNNIASEHPERVAAMQGKIDAVLAGERL